MTCLSAYAARLRDNVIVVVHLPTEEGKHLVLPLEPRIFAQLRTLADAERCSIEHVLRNYYTESVQVPMDLCPRA